MTSPTFQRCLVVTIQMGCWVVQLGLLSKRAPLPWSCLSARVIKHWKPIWAKCSNCIFTLLQLEQPQQQNATSAAWAIYTNYKMLCPVQPALWSYNNDRVQGHYCCFSSVLCINMCQLLLDITVTSDGYITITFSLLSVCYFTSHYLQVYLMCFCASCYN